MITGILNVFIHVYRFWTSQFGTYHEYWKENKKRKKRTQYFVCRGDPIYGNPSKQLKDVKSGNFFYLDLRNNHILRRKLTHHAHNIRITPDIVQGCGSPCGVRQGSSAASTKNSNNLRRIDEDTEEQVLFSLRLDFGRRPRMNRHNTAEIELHNKKQADKDARTRSLY